MHSIWLFFQQIKIGKVIPLYLTGPTNQLGNYRPTSLLPSMSKNFERVILNRLVSFFQCNEILIQTQFGV